MMHAYYHATVHRRSVLPFPINHGDSVHVRAMPCETFASLRELFEQRGWPTKQPNSPRYVFLRQGGQRSVLGWIHFLHQSFGIQISVSFNDFLS